MGYSTFTFGAGQSALRGFVLLLAAAPALAADAGRTPGAAFRAIQNGSSVAISFRDEQTVLSLAAWEAGTPQAREIGLSYYRQQMDPASQKCAGDPHAPGGPGSAACIYTRYSYEFGYGNIPRTALRIGNTGALLDASLANSPSFVIEYCTHDSETRVTECNPGAGGEVRLTWRSNGLSSTVSNGTTALTVGTYTLRTQGSLRAASATAAGSFFGTDYPYLAGDISRGTNLVREFIPAPTP